MINKMCWDKTENMQMFVWFTQTFDEYVELLQMKLTTAEKISNEFNLKHLQQ